MKNAKMDEEAEKMEQQKHREALERTYRMTVVQTVGRIRPAAHAQEVPYRFPPYDALHAPMKTVDGNAPLSENVNNLL